MYLPIEGGSTEVVEGLTCWIPPQPPDHEIANYGLPREQQKWVRPLPPEGYAEAREEEEFEEELLEMQKQDLLKKKRGRLTPEDREFLKQEHYNERLEAYRVQEWERRMNGYWLFINGKATYLTGKHYFYLAHCQLDIGYPSYFDVSRRNFYFREYCFNCDTCLGYLVVGSRGVGKTAEEVSVALEELTRPPGNRIGAIQSKSEDDALLVVFQAKMVPMYQNLPHFFKPVDSHGSNPTSFLRWARENVRGRNARKVTFNKGEELKNSIQAYPAKEKKLDGSTLAIIIEDEVGKTDPKLEADVYKRAEVNRFCVFRFGRKVGMILSMTTVEEMDKGGRECKKLWDHSNQDSIEPGQMTITGRYRRFYGVLEADPRFFDEFGMCNAEAARAFHDAERLAREGDPQALASYIRKNPYFADEAFQENADDCQFNAMIIDQRRRELEVEDPTVTGDFEWSDGPDSRVVWVPNKSNGHCRLWWLPSNPEETNLIEHTIDMNMFGQRLKKPLNDHKFVIGADPIQYGVTVDGVRKSRPVTYVHRRYDPAVDCGELTLEKLVENATEVWKDGKLIKPKFKYKTGLEIVEYDYRPDEPTVYYEYMIKLCVFFGCKIHVEAQKAGGMIAHFNARGYSAFIEKKVVVAPDLKKQQQAEMIDGTAATPGLIQDYTGLIAKSITYFGHRWMFKKLLNDVRRFKPQETTKFDYTVAKGFVELSLLKPVKVVDQAPMDISEYMPIFRNNELVDTP